MKAYGLFPVLVAEFEYPYHAEFKQLFFQNMEKYAHSSGMNTEQGYIDLQTYPEFQPFYTFVATCAKEYVGQLGVDPDEWMYYIVKSWWNGMEQENIQMHSHCDAHLSFAYYLSTPPESNKLLFVAGKDYKNDLTNGMFMENYEDVSPVQEWNQFTPAQAFDAVEGKLMIFPSTLEHCTVPYDPYATEMNPGYDEPSVDPEALKKLRISIAGDFLMTFKEPTSKALGIQPIEKWIRFS